MNYQEFLDRLEQLLQDAPAEERAEALRFYSEYFNEAGPEQEQAILEELVSPENVAAIIRESVTGQEGAPQENQPAPERNIPLPIYARPGGRSNPAAAEYCKSHSDKHSNVILIVLLAVLLFPVWGSLFMAVLSIALSVVITGVALLFGGIVGALGGLFLVFWNLFTLIPLGFGTALLASGLMLLVTAACVALIGAGSFILFWLIPAVCHVLKKYVIDPLRGKRGAQA